MTYENILAMWEFTRGKFTEKVEEIDESELPLKLEKMTIGQLIYHTAQVEYIFSEWFFGKKPEREMPKNIHENKAALLQYLAEANQDLIAVMKALPEEKWSEKVASRRGESTPAEAIARLIYHAGIHAGQITMIQKIAKS